MAMGPHKESNQQWTRDDLLYPTPAVPRVSNYRLTKPFTYSAAGQVMRGMEGRAPLLADKPRQTP